MKINHHNYKTYRIRTTEFNNFHLMKNVDKENELRKVYDKLNSIFHPKIEFLI